MGITLETSQIIGSHCSAYEQRRSELEKNLKTKDFWPKGLREPNNFRKFIVADDLSYCGFAKDEETLNIERARFYKRKNNEKDKGIVEIGKV